MQLSAARATRAARAIGSGGVPLLIGNDSVHGHANLRGATLFPHHIGQGCMNDAALVEELARLSCRESHACGINWMFAPCCTVPDDLRWGRTYEAFSEDPAVVAELAAAEVRGIQTCGVPMAACVKHWVADGATALGTGTKDFEWTGAPVGVLDQGDAQIDERELRDRHVAAYLPALAASGAAAPLTVMVSYSSWNGVKAHASLSRHDAAEGGARLRRPRRLRLQRRAAVLSRRLQGGARPRAQRRDRHGDDGGRHVRRRPARRPARGCGARGGRGARADGAD